MRRTHQTARKTSSNFLAASAVSEEVDDSELLCKRQKTTSELLTSLNEAVARKDKELQDMHEALAKLHQAEAARAGKEQELMKLREREWTNALEAQRTTHNHELAALRKELTEERRKIARLEALIEDDSDTEQPSPQ